MGYSNIGIKENCYIYCKKKEKAEIGRTSLVRRCRLEFYDVIEKSCGCW